MTRLRPALLALALATPTQAQAQAIEFTFPGPAQETAAATETAAAYALPVGPWDGATFQSRQVEGTVIRRAFRIDAPQSTVALMADLRAQVESAGWRVLYECDAPVCGGFDFRFATVILPEPDMHVDLGDFRVLSADRGDEVLNLIVSRSTRAGFVQVTLARPGGGAEQAIANGPKPDSATKPLLLPELPDPADLPDPSGSLALPSPPPTGAPPANPGQMETTASDIGARLLADGHVVLADLRFASGASALEDGDYPSLAALAEWLKADSTRRIVLVGHTDASGGLDSNIILSKRRASAVRAELVGAHGVAPAQVVAEGVGFLAPLAPNSTAEGQKRNRRVEAVLLAAGG